MMDRLYSGWRMATKSGTTSDGASYAFLGPQPGKTLFETLEQAPLSDQETYILCRRKSAFAVLNVYPYTSGHILVLPRSAATGILKLTDEQYSDLWELVRVATEALQQAFRPQGINIGINEGVAGGGSQPDHLHVHVVPRWSADTNFMTSVAETRILPMALSDSWSRLRDAWPEPLSPEPLPSES